jgi:hypothetical protein
MTLGEPSREAPAPLRLTLDARAERAVAGLRLAGAAAALGAAAWMLALGPGLLGGVLVGVSALAGAGWLAAAALGRRRARAPDAWSLEADEVGLRLREGAEGTTVAWAEVTRVDVDEDRLVVRLYRAAEEPVTIEPRYAGLSVYALAGALEERRAASGRAAGRGLDGGGRPGPASAPIDPPEGGPTSASHSAPGV